MNDREVQAADAHQSNEKILALKRYAALKFIELGAELFKFRENEYYKALGHPSFHSYLCCPEVTIEQSLAYRLIQTYQIFQVNHPTDEDRLSRIGTKKVFALLPVFPVVEESERDELLHKAETLTYEDLLKELPVEHKADCHHTFVKKMYWKCEECGHKEYSDPEG